VIIFFSTFLLFYFLLQTTVEFKPNWSWAEVNRSCNHHLKSISGWTVMLLTILAKKISIDDDTGTSRKYRRQENRYLKCTFNKASAILDTVNINKFHRRVTRRLRVQRQNALAVQTTVHYTEINKEVSTNKLECSLISAGGRHRGHSRLFNRRPWPLDRLPLEPPTNKGGNYWHCNYYLLQTQPTSGQPHDPKCNVFLKCSKFQRRHLLTHLLTPIITY